MIASPTDPIPESGIGFPTTKYLDRKVDQRVPCFLIVFNSAKSTTFSPTTFANSEIITIFANGNIMFNPKMIVPMT